MFIKYINLKRFLRQVAERDDWRKVKCDIEEKTCQKKGESRSRPDFVKKYIADLSPQ